MKTQEFKIGAVYSPDGGRTTMLIAAPNAFELRRAWACFAQVKLDPDMAFRIKAIEDGEELTDAEKMRLRTVEASKKIHPNKHQ